MNINWKVRLKNYTFWATMIPAILLLIQAVAAIFGFTIDLTELQGQLLAVLDLIFVILATLGIVVDHTTKGTSDSNLALSYDKPRGD